MLYTKDKNDKAQKWRAMYAGKDGEHTLYWLNCVLGGIAKPFALDRFTGALRNNADVYLAVKSSARDQLLYFTEVDDTGRVYIHLYDKLNSQDNPTDLVLTAAPNPNGVNGNNSPTTLTQAGNVYWSLYADGNPMQRWMVEEVSPGAAPSTDNRATDFPYDKYYQNEQNIFYPGFVGECTWYCNGRFLEVNERSNFCTGKAASWATEELPSKLGLGRDVGQDGIIKLRSESVAVFGTTPTNQYGHVVFIESFDEETKKVVYSETNSNKVFATSNGEIEVWNSVIESENEKRKEEGLTLLVAKDGYKQETSEEDFRSLYGLPLLGIIYKKSETIL